MYPCPKCGTATKVRTTGPVLGKSVPVIRRNRRCLNPDCDAQFDTAEFVCGPVVEHYTRIRQEKKEARRALTARHNTPPITTPLVCPHCGASKNGVRQSLRQEEHYARYHHCHACQQKFWSFTSYAYGHTEVLTRMNPLTEEELTW